MIMELKTLLAPMFNVDLDELLQKGGSVVLDEPEIGLFFGAEVIRGDVSDKICFSTSALIITPELAAFIGYCATVLGNDMAGCGAISQIDYYLLDKKLFYRIWPGLYIHVRHDDELDIDELVIEITIKHSEL